MGGRLSLGWQAAIDGGALLAPEPHFSFFLCFPHKGVLEPQSISMSKWVGEPD